MGDRLLITAYTLPVVLLAFALHEMAHAYSATWFGDPTPAQHGRRTLNPIRHLDPLGTIMIVVSMVLFGYPLGFAVTPVDDSKLRRPRLHSALVSFAGPLVNIVLCAISLAAFVVLTRDMSFEELGRPLLEQPVAVLIAYYSMLFNAFLAVFNLLPIPPLDGGRILGSFMNDDTRREWRKIDEYGIFIILGLVLLGGSSFTAFVGGLQDQLLRIVGLFVGQAGIVG